MNDLIKFKVSVRTDQYLQLQNMADQLMLTSSNKQRSVSAIIRGIIDFYNENRKKANKYASKSKKASSRR